MHYSRDNSVIDFIKKIMKEENINLEKHWSSGIFSRAMNVFEGLTEQFIIK